MAIAIIPRRQQLNPAVRQTSKGDTEFDMSVTVLSASGEPCSYTIAVWS